MKVKVFKDFLTEDMTRSDLKVRIICNKNDAVSEQCVFYAEDVPRDYDAYIISGFDIINKNLIEISIYNRQNIEEEWL